jgi:hypothetical protein
MGDILVIIFQEARVEDTKYSYILFIPYGVRIFVLLLVFMTSSVENPSEDGQVARQGNDFRTILVIM